MAMMRRSRRLQASSITVLLLVSVLRVDAFGCEASGSRRSQPVRSVAEPRTPAARSASSRLREDQRSAGAHRRLDTRWNESEEDPPVSLGSLPFCVLTGLAASSLTRLADLGESKSASAVSWLSRRSSLERQLLGGLVSAAVTWGVNRMSDRPYEPGPRSECPEGQGRIETLCV